MRPETEMIQEMRKRGFPFHQSRRIIGSHDFKQYYLDVYLKAFLHSKKHGMLMHLIEPIWQHLSQNDMDFRIALSALCDARSDTDHPQISRDFRRASAEKALASLALSEKPPLEVEGDTILPRLAAEPLDDSHPALAQTLAQLQALIDNHVLTIEATGDRSTKGQFLEWARRLFGFSSKV